MCSMRTLVRLVSLLTAFLVNQMRAASSKPTIFKQVTSLRASDHPGRSPKQSCTAALNLLKISGLHPIQSRFGADASPNQSDSSQRRYPNAPPRMYVTERVVVGKTGTGHLS